MSTMTGTDSGIQSPQDTVDPISQSLTKANLQDDPTHSARPHQRENSVVPIPPIVVYTRSQLLSLYNSPLVQPPLNMPDLKGWFGADLDQMTLKKEAEPSSSGSRAGRFRRDAEDGDTRPSFRSAISQPSQMGNFKHHSLRAGDRDKERDRDRDGDKDRERDFRDREGQERLRHLSDKYDRDRMALSGSGGRGKEKDGPSNTSSRLSSQSSAAPTRRTENKDGSKKRSGEGIEEWRRIGEPSRPGREERLDNGRRDRDDRERPRSRIRDSSRPRREVSAARRERDDSARERSSRSEREEHRRERERDDSEYDDPRHWRDDGRRDERVAARRERENKDRPRDATWDSTNDRRWTAEDRDARTKRPARDKKSLQGDDPKDREERRDRERDRDKEKEKEPAWMDAYIPSGTSFVIMGGKGPDGELDGIQAWKKGMKEKEQREKEKEQILSIGEDEPTLDVTSEKLVPAEKQLDEIQLFKLLMKREEEKRKTDLSSSTAPVSPDPADLDSSKPNGTTAMVSPTSPKDASLPLLVPLNMEPSQTSNLCDPLKGASAQLDTLSLDDSVALRKASGSRYSANAAQPEHTSVLERTGNEAVAPYNPPSASRLLSLARPPNLTSRSPTIGSSNGSIHPNTTDPLYGQMAIKSEGTRPGPGFPPFEEPNRPLSTENTFNINAPDTVRRLHADRPSNVDFSHLDGAALEINPGYPGSRGSRFAKFFDNRSRESSAPMHKPQTPTAMASSSPHPSQRSEQIAYEPLHGNATEPRTLEDIFAMLNNSSQGHRSIINPPVSVPHNPSISQQAQNNLQLLQQAAYQQQAQQLQASHRLEPLYESRLEDRNFVPDGMVPGLRTIPTRNRDGPSYAEGLEDIMHHNLQRPPQQRLESIYSAPLFNSQRNVGIPVQQGRFRGGHSPIPAQQGSLQNMQQRLPPALANLGARPQHDLQYPNMPGVPTPGLHAAVPLNGLLQQNFNAFTPNAGLGFNGPPLSGPLPNHQLQNSLAMGSLNPQNNLNPNQAQYLAMNGASIGGLRSMNNGLGPQQGQGSQLHNPLLPLRQQALHPHTLPHMVPPHLSQPGLGAQTNQPTHDLMALLMGGPHRE